MERPTNISRPPNAVRRANAAQRPGHYRDKLLAVGEKLFTKHGITGVSVEQLVATADLSRATFYGFFANKNELAAAILLPVFDSGTAALRNLDKLPPHKAAEELINVYLQLWKEHRNALLLTSNFDGAVFPYIKLQHDAFNSELVKILNALKSSRLLRNNSVDLTMEVIAKTAIPLLRIYRDREDMEYIFRDSMLGLMIRT
jgi:AcrR family transcriptional regulator